MIEVLTESGYWWIIALVVLLFFAAVIVPLVLGKSDIVSLIIDLLKTGFYSR